MKHTSADIKHIRAPSYSIFFSTLEEDRSGFRPQFHQKLPLAIACQFIMAKKNNNTGITISLCWRLTLSVSLSLIHLARFKPRAISGMNADTRIPSLSTEQKSPGRIVAPATSTTTLSSPSPRFALFTGQAARARTPIRQSLISSTSRTQPLTIIPDQPCVSASLATFPPTSAVLKLPPPSITKILPNPDCSNALRTSTLSSNTFTVTTWPAKILLRP